MTDRPAPTPYPDEISLRDLYLTLRRGLPWIGLAAVLAAAVALLAMALMPPRYAAEATVTVSPTPVRIQGDASLAFDPRNEVSFETYREIAQSAAVLERALAAAPGGTRSPGALRADAELRRISGPARADQSGQMTLAHRVVADDPEEAAALANAWARASLETVRAALLASIDPVREETVREAERRGEELAAIEDEWQAFQARDDSDLLTARLEALADRVALGEDELLLLERAIANARGRLAALAAQLGEDVPLGGGPAGDAAALARLFASFESDARPTRAETAEGEEEARGPTDEPPLAARLAPLLELSADPGDAVTQLARADLVTTAARLAATVAERDRLEARLEEDAVRADALRSRLAGLLQERSRLEARLRRASSAVDDIGELEPVISYVRGLTATTTRVLNDAAPPAGPSGPDRLLVAALAALAAAGLATLVVLLREAVRPEGAR